MNDLTLKSLAERVAAIERALEIKPSEPDREAWHTVVGMFGDSDFMRQVDEEGQKIREAERAQARQEPAAQ